MRNCIFSVLFLVLLSSSIVSAAQQSQNPKLVFFVNHEDEQQKDYVEITLQIQAQDSSLTNSIQAAATTVQQISNLAKEFCNENSKKKADCKDIVDAGKFNVQPRYQVIKKNPTFMEFVVTHEMTISVKNVQNIGYLVDKILSKSGITLQTFEWKALQEPKTHQDAIAEGMEQGQGLCQQLGLKLGKIISIEQVKEQQTEEQEEQGQQEEQQEQEEEEDDQGQQATVFRFEVECAENSKEKKQ